MSEKNRIIVFVIFFISMLVNTGIFINYGTNQNKTKNIIIQNKCVVRSFDNDEIVLPSRVVNLLYLNQYYHLSEEDSIYLKNFIDNGR